MLDVNEKQSLDNIFGQFEQINPNISPKDAKREQEMFWSQIKSTILERNPSEATSLEKLY